MNNQPVTNFDARTFRRALGNFATGITIITAQNEAGETVGVTANSFNSVSIDPPLILWSIDKRARSYEVFNTASHFAVNVLAADQIELSNHFARQQEDKFADIVWESGEGGAPLLENCAARFQCKSYRQVDGGDHWIMIGEVVTLDDFGRAPLCFHQGSYSMVIGHPGASKDADNVRAETASQGRLSENVYYLMLQALRTYQTRYLPKQEALGLSTIEARCILMISDRPGINVEGLYQLSDMPQNELSEATVNLTERGLIGQEGNGFVLTLAGHDKADEFWQLADAHAQQVLKDLSEEQVVAFKQTLRTIACSN